MNCGHITCTGQVCTAANVPVRPLTGKAREKSELTSALKQVIGTLYGYVVKETVNSLVVQCYLGDAVRLVDAFYGVFIKTGLDKKWEWKTTLVSASGMHWTTVTVQYKRRKDV